MVSFIIGYLIIINIISFALVMFCAKYDLKIKKGILDIIYIILAILCGFLGLLVASEMYNYRRDDKIFKRIIPLIILIEVCGGIYLYWSQNH